VLRRARPLLGTYVEVAACADAPEVEWAAVAAAFDAIAEVHRLMSFHESTSDVGRLNRGAHARALEVDPRTFAVLRRARLLARASGGLFDCTVGGAAVALGLLPGARGAPRRGATSWRDVELLPGRRVRFLRRLALDLGGIAKGFAVDEAVAALVRCGASAGCVNAGGDLRVFGARDWPVAIRAPGEPDRLVPLPPLRDGALATTADDFSPDGAGHVIQPATGRRRPAPISVSVLAPSCMDADALTKVVWLSERTPAALLARLRARAIVLVPGGEERGTRARESVGPR
jgi:thiamine biosynthesis lipoprotein